MIQVSTGQPDFYRFDEGQRESILRIISAARSILSRNAISRAGEGLPSSRDSFRHAKIVAMTPSVRLRPSSISFSIGVLRKNLRQRRGTTVYYYFFYIPKQLNRTRPVFVEAPLRIGAGPISDDRPYRVTWAECWKGAR
jgi:hypothetical protein